MWKKHKIYEAIRSGRIVYILKVKGKAMQKKLYHFLCLSRLIRPFLRNRWHGQKLVLGDNNRNFVCYGWETVDILDADYIVDFRNHKLPFPDNTAKLVVCSHMIEHISDESAGNVFAEVHRVLRPGGTFRVICPDMEKAIAAYKNNDLDFFLKPYGFKASSKVGFGNSKESLALHNNLVRILASYASDGMGPEVDKETVDRKLSQCDQYEFAKWCVSLLKENRAGERCIWGHVNAYDYAKLERMLSQAGFSRVVRSSFRKSAVKELRKRCFDLKSHNWISLYVEATNGD